MLGCKFSIVIFEVQTQISLVFSNTVQGLKRRRAQEVVGRAAKSAKAEPTPPNAELGPKFEIRLALGCYSG